MTRLSIIVCDYCNGLLKEKMPLLLTLQKGRGKDKEVTKSEICQTCYETILAKINTEFELNKIPSAPIPQEKKVISNGETIIKSNVDNITRAPGKQENVCDHPSTAFEPPNVVKCNKCGDTWTT